MKQFDPTDPNRPEFTKLQPFLNHPLVPAATAPERMQQLRDAVVEAFANDPKGFCTALTNNYAYSRAASIDRTPELEAQYAQHVEDFLYDDSETPRLKRWDPELAGIVSFVRTQEKGAHTTFWRERANESSTSSLETLKEAGFEPTARAYPVGADVRRSTRPSPLRDFSTLAHAAGRDPVQLLASERIKQKATQAEYLLKHYPDGNWSKKLQRSNVDEQKFEKLFPVEAERLEVGEGSPNGSPERAIWEKYGRALLTKEDRHADLAKMAAREFATQLSPEAQLDNARGIKLWDPQTEPLEKELPELHAAAVAAGEARHDLVSGPAEAKHSASLDRMRSTPAMLQDLSAQRPDLADLAAKQGMEFPISGTPEQLVAHWKGLNCEQLAATGEGIDDEETKALHAELASRAHTWNPRKQLRGEWIRAELETIKSERSEEAGILAQDQSTNSEAYDLQTTRDSS